MAHFERGVYEPNEDVRVFDGSEDDDDVEGSRLPLLIVLALLVLAMFAGVVWLAYTQGVARGRTETPVLTAQNGPARIAPQNPGGAEQPYKGFKIYEQPAPPDDDVDTATTAAVPAAPTRVAQVPAPVAAAPKPVALTPPPAAVVPPKPVAVAAPKPEPKVAAVVPAKVAPAAIKPPPAVAAKPTPATAPVVVKKELAPVAAAPVGPATAAPRSLALVPAKPAAVAAPPVATAAAASGTAILQIGAYKSQAEADGAWKTYKAKHAALLAGANEDVQQADLGDKGTWYRLRIVGFPSKDVASAMCDRLKADGGGCFLGK
jgi:cell division protein FtsN